MPFVLKEEGGFVNDPRDPGGATFCGVTLATFRTFIGAPDATPDDLKRATPALIAQIYKQEYWDKCSAAKLPLGADLSVFDMAVNAGPDRSMKLLQRAVGVDQDGIIGPATLRAVNALADETLIRRLYTEQAGFYRSLPTFQTFGRGWINRCTSRMNAALGSVASAKAAKVA